MKATFAARRCFSLRLGAFVLPVLLLASLAACKPADQPAEQKSTETKLPEAAPIESGGPSDMPQAEPPAADGWRLVLVDKFDHVVAPLDNRYKNCKEPQGDPESGQEGLVYPTARIQDVKPSPFESGEWPKDRVWKVVTLDGKTISTRFTQRISIPSEFAGGCEYLASENLGEPGSKESWLGDLHPAIAFAPQAKVSPLRAAPTLHRGYADGEEKTPGPEAQVMEKALAEIITARGLPAEFKAQWPAISAKPAYLAVIPEQRGGKPDSLALVVWRTPDDEGDRKPLWMFAHVAASPYAIVAAPAAGPQENYFYTPAIMGVVDVDGDGTDEVIAMAGFYEGSQFIVWSLTGKTVNMLASTPYFGL